jgi:1-acyl-sn-glycerol-3-phosphate acyltransferase
MNERAERLVAGGESSTAAAARARRGGASQALIKTPLAPADLRPTPAGRLLFWWSFFVAGLLLLIFGPPTILVAWAARRREWVYPVALWGGRQWVRLSGMRVVVRGREHLRPGAPYILVSNHRSYLDTATLFCHLGRRIGLFAKKELLKVPILGYGMGYVNILAIDRSNRERAIRTVGEATERIRSGIPFGVFAEGTRARPGELLPFKKGAFYMAAETGVPIIPVAIKHTDVLMGKGTGFARAGTIEMVLLPPVPVEDLPADHDEAVARLIGETRARIAAELLAA